MLDTFVCETPFTGADAKELTVLLGNKSMRKAIALVLTKAEAMDKLSSYDLIGPEGLSKAIEAAGLVRGMKFALESLVELAQFEDEENDDSVQTEK